MDTQLNISNLGMAFLNNTRNVNDIDPTLKDIKRNINEISENLKLILMDLNLDNETTVSNYKKEIIDLSNVFHNELGY